MDVSIGGIHTYFDFDSDGVGVEDISEVRCSVIDRFVAEDGDLTFLPFDEIDNDGDVFVECEIVEWKYLQLQHHHYQSRNRYVFHQYLHPQRCHSYQ